MELHVTSDIRSELVDEPSTGMADWLVDLALASCRDFFLQIFKDQL